MKLETFHYLLVTYLVAKVPYKFLLILKVVPMPGRIISRGAFTTLLLAVILQSTHRLCTSIVACTLQDRTADHYYHYYFQFIYNCLKFKTTKKNRSTYNIQILVFIFTITHSCTPWTSNYCVIIILQVSYCSTTDSLTD